MENDTKIVVINGPKNSGKDEIGEHLASRRSDCVVQQFKAQLLIDTVDYYGVNEEWFYDVYSNRDTKDSPLVEFGGKSPRQAVIHVSEDVMKPHYGLEYYGQHLVGDMVSGMINIITDGGVANINQDAEEDWIELRPIVSQFSKENILIVQLYRDGCSFEGDSRRYFGDPNMDDVIIGEYHPMGSLSHEDNPIFTSTTSDIDCMCVYNGGTLKELHDTFDYTVGNFKRGTL